GGKMRYARRLPLFMLMPAGAFAVVEAQKNAPDKSSIYVPAPADRVRGAAANEAVNASPGPHLFLDDALIASSRNLARHVRQPVRDASIPNPIVRGKEDGCYQPYFGVSHDPQTGRYRIWFGVPMNEAHDGSRS